MKVKKGIKGYIGYYEIISSGIIISLKRKGVRNDRILKLCNHRGYITVLLTKNGKAKSYQLQRLLFQHFKGKLIDGMVIDHIDNNKLNNSLDNLQQISIGENVRKDSWRRKSTSKYLGVCWCKVKNKWRSTINNKNKQKHIGYFINELEASEAYQIALRSYEN